MKMMSGWIQSSAIASLLILSTGCVGAPDPSSSIPDPAKLAAAAEARTSNPNMPSRWWTEHETKSASFYRSEEGREMARNILSWQNEDGGWPLMTTVREPFNGDMDRVGPWGQGSALVKSTVNELRFLARGYNATEDEAYKAAVVEGINFIVNSQYPNGGWPHSVNPRTDYDQNVGYNDDEVPDLMAFLQDVNTTGDFAFLDGATRKAVAGAFNSALGFVLETQIIVDGTKTAWAQQYDPQSLKPVNARAFEPAAISGGESATVLMMLMDISKPSEEVKAAIEAGVQWYRDVQIDGIRVDRSDGDRTVVVDADAEPVWARFYDLDSMRPIFAGRDGIIRYDLAEIEKERRGGYAWYNTHGTKVFARYDDWKKQRLWDSAPKSNIEESAVGDYTLPALLTTQDGQAVETVQAWETKRRAEVLNLLATYQQGQMPTKRLSQTFKVLERGAPSLNGTAIRTQARVEFPDSDVRIRVLLLTPADATGPVPTIVHLGFSPNIMTVDEPGIDEGTAWSATLKAPVPDRDAYPLTGFEVQPFIDAGYGVALVYYGDIYPDFDHGNMHGVPTLFGDAGDEQSGDEWGAIGSWAWGLSRVMDYLQTDPAVDAQQIALSGVSRLGKSVLWAAAQDERYSMVIPMLSGEGGAAISRRHYGETVADLTNPSRYDYWYAENYQSYAFDVDALPVDGHMLLAMAAPRPTLLITGSEDTWSDPKGEWVSAKAAQEVWALYGAQGPQGDVMPAPGEAASGDLAFFMHEGGHTVVPEDFEQIISFMDEHFEVKGGR